MSKTVRALRRLRACNDFEKASEQASQSGFDLIKRSDSHYQISPNDRSGQWLVNLYPGNCRIYADKNRPPAPFLNLFSPWDLFDIVDLIGGKA